MKMKAQCLRVSHNEINGATIVSMMRAFMDDKQPKVLNGCSGVPKKAHTQAVVSPSTEPGARWMSMVHYSPFAFASSQLEEAFQKSWPQQVSQYMYACVVLAWGLAFALTYRMYLNVDAMGYHFPGHLPLQFWLPAFLSVVGTGVVLLALNFPKLYQRNWILWTAAIRGALTVAVLETWRFMPPEPAVGPLTFGSAVLTFFVRALTPAVLILPAMVPLPLAVHTPMQLLLLAGLFRADADLCALRLASPDLPAQLDSMVWLISQAAPYLADVFRKFPQYRCLLVLSLGQALASAAGTVMSFSQEIRMRRVFLKQDPAAQPHLRGLPRAPIQSYPFSHPKGVLQYACFLLGTVTYSVLAWQLFVVLSLYH
eukprot:jgi/Botrbrau1/2222/Bobra.101_2s0051.1